PARPGDRASLPPRRSSGLLFLLAPALGPGACAAVRSGAVPSSAALAALEKAHGGRLGVCVLDTGTRAMLHWRGDERFALCSTFKDRKSTRLHSSHVHMSYA